MNWTKSDENVYTCKVAGNVISVFHEIDDSWRIVCGKLKITKHIQATGAVTASGIPSDVVTTASELVAQKFAETIGNLVKASHELDQFKISWFDELPSSDLYLAANAYEYKMAKEMILDRIDFVDHVTITYPEELEAAVDEFMSNKEAGCDEDYCVEQALIRFKELVAEDQDDCENDGDNENW